MKDDDLIVNPEIEKTWREALASEFQVPYFKEIQRKIREEKRAGVVLYPEEKDIFKAFNLTPFNKVKVVILGQDPYHGVGQAHGLCFSVPDGVNPPPSLKNIFKELRNDLGIEMPTIQEYATSHAPKMRGADSGLSETYMEYGDEKPQASRAKQIGMNARLHGNLEGWADQGVLLLNALLTVRAGEPASHKDIGWEEFTDAVMKKLSDERENIVFILWGKFAQEKESLIESSKHLVLKSAHPSPFSATKFFGNKHFSKTNEYLTAHSKVPIAWENM